MLKLERDINDSLTLTADFIYARQRNVTRINRGSVTATVFGPGQRAGRRRGADQSVLRRSGRRQQRDRALPGRRAVRPGRAVHRRRGVAVRHVHRPTTTSAPTGARCSARRSARRQPAEARRRALRELRAARLERHDELGGNPTTPSVPGTTTAVLGLPLTAANALDVWSPAGSNRTSAALRSQLLDSMQLQTAHQTIKDFTLKFDGPLFDLPGGAVRAAVGVEYIEYTMREEVSRERGTGPASTNSLDDLHRPRPRREVGDSSSCWCRSSARATRSQACGRWTSTCPAATTTTATSATRAIRSTL